MRILNHLILGDLPPKRWIEIEVHGEKIKAIDDEAIKLSLLAVENSTRGGENCSRKCVARKEVLLWGQR